MCSTDPTTPYAGILHGGLGVVYTAVSFRVSTGPSAVSGSLGVPDPATSEKMAPGTPFDLASLTKLFTTAAILRLVEQEHLRLDDQVARYLPGFRGGTREQVKVLHLLTHTSGLPAGVRLHGAVGAAKNPSQEILRVPLDGLPGDTVRYSDVGYMLLGRLIELVTGGDLRAAMNRLVLEPLGLQSVSYGPRPEAPATEYDVQRGERVRGDVHDESAAALGGVAGHAGLFGNASDLERLARCFADPFSDFLSPDLVRRATAEWTPGASDRRGLGWKLRSAHPEAAEHPFSPESFGHYGFTGTAVWHDPQRNLTAVLLTNRVYFGRDPAGIHRVRRNFFARAAQLNPPQR